MPAERYSRLKVGAASNNSDSFFKKYFFSIKTSNPDATSGDSAAFNFRIMEDEFGGILAIFPGESGAQIFMVT